MKISTLMEILDAVLDNHGDVNIYFATDDEDPWSVDRVVSEDNKIILCDKYVKRSR